MYLVRSARCVSVQRIVCSSINTTWISAKDLGIRNPFAFEFFNRATDPFPPLFFGILWCYALFGSSIFGAQGLRSWGSECRISPCDEPFISRILTWRNVPFEKCTLRFSPNDFGTFRKNDLDFGESRSWNTQPICFKLFNKATEPFPPDFFGFLLGRLSTSACLNTHFSPNFHPDSHCVILTYGRMPTITWRIRSFLYGSVSMVFGIFFHNDCGPWSIFLSKNFSRRFESAALEQDRTIVLPFHANCRRDGSCEHLLLYSVLLLSTDSFLIILSALTFFLFWVLTNTPDSSLSFLAWTFRVLIFWSLHFFTMVLNFW